MAIQKAREAEIDAEEKAATEAAEASEATEASDASEAETPDNIVDRATADEMAKQLRLSRHDTIKMVREHELVAPCTDDENSSDTDDESEPKKADKRNAKMALTVVTKQKRNSPQIVADDELTTQHALLEEVETLKLPKMSVSDVAVAHPTWLRAGAATAVMTAIAAGVALALAFDH